MTAGRRADQGTGTGVIVVGTRRAATVGTIRGPPAIGRGSAIDYAGWSNVTHKRMARHEPHVWSTALAFRTSSLLAKCNTVVLV